MNRQYLVIIERAPHNFAAYSPDLPGCVATGETKEETLTNMRDAVSFHLRGLREDGEPIPPASSTAEYVRV
ncbi:MAG: type II toxin-antitoxin system HicB family antitoxin [Chloroflexota bacterium]